MMKKTIKKYQNSGKGVPPAMSSKDSMMMYGRRSDSLRSEAAGKLMRGEDASKDLRGAEKARAKEKAIAKRTMGVTPSDRYKMGGKLSKSKKAVKAGPMMKKNGKMSKKK